MFHRTQDVVMISQSECGNWKIGGFQTLLNKKQTVICRVITCFTIVTAVVPLQKQSIVGWTFNSLSINLEAFKRDCFSVRYISGRFSFSSTSKGSVHSSSMITDAVNSEFTLPGGNPFWLGLLWPLTLPIHSVHNLRGKESLTFLATRWPKGPWPSKTPQKMVSLLEAKFYNHGTPFSELQRWTRRLVFRIQSDLPIWMDDLTGMSLEKGLKDKDWCITRKTDNVTVIKQRISTYS